MTVVRLALALTTARLRLAVVPQTAVRRRQSVQVCSAARILTALGVRVHVVQPERPWPRDRPLVLITPDHGRLADLAVVTAVPRTTPGWSALADRVLPAASGTVGPPALVPRGTLRCGVAVSFRTDAGGLVVEVTLLAAEEQPPARYTESAAA